MRAVLIATGYHSQLEPLVSYRPSPLLNIADKPILFHIIEALVRQGVKKYDLILSHLPEQIEEVLKDGKRWGIEIEYHLIKNDLYPFKVLKIANHWKSEKILLGQADAIPYLPRMDSLGDTLPILFNLEKWSGWGVFSTDFLANLPDDTTIESLPDLINEGTQITVKAFLSAKELKNLIQSNQHIMNEETPSTLFPTTAKKVEPGVWISKAVVLEPGVEVIPPVFIGKNSQIKSGARIGPNTVIENHSIIDSSSIVENSLICQNSYVGEALEVRQCIIDRNSLINLDHGTHIQVKEDFILSEATPPSLRSYLFELLEKGSALLLISLLFPVYIWMWITCERKSIDKLLLPTSISRKDWKTVTLTTFIGKSAIQTFFQRLPFLFNIASGKIHFIGVSPRSIAEVEQLPQEWQSLYLKAKIGLITLANLEHGDHPTIDENYASEVYYSSQMSFWFDLRIFFRWLAQFSFPKNVSLR